MVITNTSRDNLIKKKLNLLNNIKYWIQEGYREKKPNGEYYELTLKKYKKNEKYIIGRKYIKIYHSLNKITKIYLICIRIH